MSYAIYNTIGKNYDVTRKADPAIAQILLKLLNPMPLGKYLDLACGSGNYTIALHNQNINIDGVDISDEMLIKAKSKSKLISWYRGDAECLPFNDKTYNGVICTLATHHMNNLNKALQEIYRVLSNEGKFVIFTATPEQMNNYWLREYFPNMIADGLKKMKSFKELDRILKICGFSNIEQFPFFVTNDLQDLFLQSGKYRPEIYLDKNVRNGISSFHVSANDIEIECGIEKLRNDIISGRINKVIKQYETMCGDYVFISGQRL